MFYNVGLNLENNQMIKMTQFNNIVLILVYIVILKNIFALKGNKNSAQSFVSKNVHIVMLDITYYKIHYLYISKLFFIGSF